MQTGTRAGYAVNAPHIRRNVSRTHFGNAWNALMHKGYGCPVQNSVSAAHTSGMALASNGGMLQAITPPDQAAQHTRKPHNTKRTRVDGILLRKRDGQAAYIEYASPFGVVYVPSMENSLEQIQCRLGDSCLTIEGRNFWPLFEDLQAKLCETVQESEHPSQAAIGVPHVERITIRLWL
jgi:hypothetical protein